MTDSHTDKEPGPFRAIPLVIQSWRTLIDDPEHLVRLAGLWLLGLVLIGGVGAASAPDLMHGPQHMRDQMLSTWFLSFGLVFFIAILVAYGSIGAAWMRYVGLGEQVEGFMAPVSKQALRLIGYPLLLGLVLIVGFLLIGVVAAALGFLLGEVLGSIVGAIFGVGVPLAMIFVGVRISLFYVEIAKSEESFDFVGALRKSWEATRGNFWRLFGGLILVILPFVPAIMIVEMAAGLIPSVLLGLLFGLAAIVIQFLSGLAPLSFLTLAHNELAGPHST